MSFFCHYYKNINSYDSNDSWDALSDLNFGLGNDYWDFDCFDWDVLDFEVDDDDQNHIPVFKGIIDNKRRNTINKATRLTKIKRVFRVRDFKKSPHNRHRKMNRIYITRD